MVQDRRGSRGSFGGNEGTSDDQAEKHRPGEKGLRLSINKPGWTVQKSLCQLCIFSPVFVN